MDNFHVGDLKAHMTRPATLASVVKSSVVKILDSAIKGLVLSVQTLNPSNLARLNKPLLSPIGINNWWTIMHKPQRKYTFVLMC